MGKKSKLRRKADFVSFKKYTELEVEHAKEIADLKTGHLKELVEFERETRKEALARATVVQDAKHLEMNGVRDQILTERSMYPTVKDVESKIGAIGSDTRAQISNLEAKVTTQASQSEARVMGKLIELESEIKPTRERSDWMRGGLAALSAVLLLGLMAGALLVNILKN